MLSAFCDGRVFGERVGSTPRVLALHGWRKDHSNLDAVVKGFDAINLDLPGFGASPEPDSVWGSKEYAQAIAPVLDEFDSPAVVFGHSFGGRVAVHLASLYPDKVRALVLTGVPLIRHAPTSKPPLAFRLAKWANKIGVFSDEKLEAEKRKRGSDDYRAATGNMRDVFVKVVNESYEDALMTISCPSEFVWGELDTSAPLGQAKEAAALLKDVHLTVVEGERHWLPESNPEPLRAAIERCLV